MVRMVNYGVNSVTGVNNRFMMAVVEMVVADAHMYGVWMDDGDVVMEKVIQLMMERCGVSHWHYGRRRGGGEVAGDEEVINVLNLSSGLGSGHSIGGEGDHGVSQRVGGERLPGQQ